MNHRGKIDELNQISGEIIGAAIAVHRELGLGLLESAYEACLVYELQQRRLKVDQPVPQPVFYKGLQLECGYRLDLLVEDIRDCRIKSSYSNSTHP
ncbi:MAG: GxxExxY protein [Microcoleaceae cyanobacterium]